MKGGGEDNLDTIFEASPTNRFFSHLTPSTGGSDPHDWVSDPLDRAVCVIEKSCKILGIFSARRRRRARWLSAAPTDLPTGLGPRESRLGRRVAGPRHAPLLTGPLTYTYVVPLRRGRRASPPRHRRARRALVIAPCKGLWSPVGSGRCYRARSASASCLFGRFDHVAELACYAQGAQFLALAGGRQRGVFRDPRMAGVSRPSPAT